MSIVEAFKRRAERLGTSLTQSAENRERLRLINRLEPTMRALSIDELRAKTDELKIRQKGADRG